MLTLAVMLLVDLTTFPSLTGWSRGSLLAVQNWPQAERHAFIWVSLEGVTYCRTTPHAYPPNTFPDPYVLFQVFTCRRAYPVTLAPRPLGIYDLVGCVCVCVCVCRGRWRLLGCSW